MDGPRDYHTKVTSLLLKNKNNKLTHLLNRNRSKDTENKFVVTEGETGVINEGSGVNICSLLYIK